MSELEEKKAQIAFIEKQFFIAIASFLAVIAWMTNHYLTADTWLMTGALISLIILAVFVIRLHRNIRQAIRELRDL